MRPVLFFYLFNKTLFYYSQLLLREYSLSHLGRVEVFIELSASSVQLLLWHLGLAIVF